jgi:hypothetical protein
MVYMYLDGEISTWGILGFFRNNIWDKAVDVTKYEFEMQGQ